MHSLPSHFDLFGQRIEPDKDRVLVVQDIPAVVREHLKNHVELTTMSPHTRLAGSYRRKTAITHIKDVDILVFVADEWVDTGIKALLATLESALHGLPKVLDETDGTVELRKQRRSVNVYLPDHDLSLDIVPVLLTTDKITDVLKVPDREWKSWVETQPLGYADFLSQLNDDHGGKIVPLVKMMKSWRDTWFMRRRPKSYWLESLVVQHLRDGAMTTAGRGYASILADLFEAIQSGFADTLDQEDGQPHVPDAMLGNNVAFNWERSHFETFMRRIDDSCGWARRAVDTDDKAKALSLWQNIFGATVFPSTEDVEEEAKRMAKLAESGALRVGTGGRVFSGTAAGVSVAAPATRFYGGGDR